MGQRKLVCPLCANRNVMFTGVKAGLIVRSTYEWVAIFTCEGSHMFSLLLADAASVLGIDARSSRWKDLQKTINRSRRVLEEWERKHLPGEEPVDGNELDSLEEGQMFAALPPQPDEG